MRLRAEIKSMIANETIYYHAKGLFSVLSGRVDAAREDAFSIGLLWNNEVARQERNRAVIIAVKDTMRDKQADSAICRGTCRRLESGSFVTDLSQRFVEGNTIVKLLATHAKRCVHQTLDD